jgi:hypothetical protein
MSTRINVTVGDGGLLDRNAQQTAANRQARVLADQRAAAEAEGVERRAADRTAAGLDPLTGLPASSASAINRLNQEPAANRSSFTPQLAAARIEASLSIPGAFVITPSSGSGALTFSVQQGLYEDPARDPSFLQGGRRTQEQTGSFDAGWITSEGLIFERFLSNGCVDNPNWEPALAGVTYSQTSKSGGFESAGVSSGTFIVFPHKKDSFFISFTSKRDVWTRHTLVETSYVETTKAEVLGATGPPCDGLFAEAVTTKIYQATATNTIFTDPPVAGYRTFRVTATAVAEVSTPAGLKAVLDDWSAKDNYTIQEDDFVVQTINPGNGTSITTSRLQSESNVVPFDVVVPTRAYIPGNKVAFSPSQLHRSYNFFSSGISASPAIFTAVNDTNIRANNSAVTTSAQYLEYHASQPNAKPDIGNVPALTLTPTNFFPFESPFFSGGSTEFTAALRSPGSETSKALKRVSFPTPINIVVWNWNDPNFCRARLLDLGFQPSDLGES